MGETSRNRAWLAAAIAFACAEAYLVGTTRYACAGFNMLGSAIELQIIVVNIGLFIATVVGMTAILSVASLDRRIVTIGAVCGTAFLTMLLFTLKTLHPTKTWIAGPVLGGVILCALTSLAVRRLPPALTAALGAIAAPLCFALAYGFAPSTGLGGCGFAP